MRIRFWCRRNGPLQKANVKTLPYPGFPTDMQPQITAVLCLAQGTSLVTESVWNNRYRYVDELKRMGASIQVDDKTAVVEGVDHLTGAPIQACDLRAGAALVIAALAAKGESEISCVQYIERGYEDIVDKLRALGADIRVGGGTRRKRGAGSPHRLIVLFSVTSVFTVWRPLEEDGDVGRHSPGGRLFLI